MKVKQGFSNLSILAQIARARDIVANMTGNLNFPTPSPTLADFTTAIDALEVAYNDASSGDRDKIAIRNLRRKEMLVIERQLAAYVQVASGGNEEIILSSGYDVVRRGDPHAPVGQVLNLHTRNGSFVGSFGALWSRVTGAGAYIVEISADGVTFQMFRVVLTISVEVTGLVAGQLYYIRVSAVGRAGHGVPSDVSVHNAAR